MSRDGSDIYSVPPGTAAVSGTPVGSSAYNTFIADLVNDLNTPRPVSMGGTGASTASGALTNLGALPTDADIVAIAALGYAARSTLVKTAANTWTLVPQTTYGDSVLALTDAAGLRSLAGLGTAATKNTGTSGNNVPLLDGANTWSAVQTYTANTPIVLQSDQAAFHFKEGGGSDRFLLGIRSDISGNDTDFLLYSLGVGTVFQVPQSTRVADFKAVPTINGVAIITGSSPTLSNPTLSGTVAGAVTFSGNSTFSGGAPIFSNLATSMPAAGSGGTLKFSNGDTNYGILFAVSNANGAGFIQAQRTDGTGTVYALSLNPNGGDIIGNSTGPTSVYSLGYRGLGNLNGQNNAYTFVLADAGRNVYHSTGTHAFEIPPNSSVPFPIGTAIEILNFGGTLTITEGSGVTLYRWDGTSGTGTRTVGQRSTAVIQKITTTEWIIMGAALT